MEEVTYIVAVLIILIQEYVVSTFQAVSANEFPFKKEEKKRKGKHR